jgi:hypothetical protein
VLQLEPGLVYTSYSNWTHPDRHLQTNWICNFIVVEVGSLLHTVPFVSTRDHKSDRTQQITPYGIQSLSWRFYIIWAVFNAAFVPMVYFLYPETAGRTLEDIDDYYRGNPSLLVWRDHEAKRTGRPQKYADKEEQEVRRNSSVDPAVLRRGSRVSTRAPGQEDDEKTERGSVEAYGDREIRAGLAHKEDV